MRGRIWENKPGLTWGFVHGLIWKAVNMVLSGSARRHTWFDSGTRVISFIRAGHATVLFRGTCVRFIHTCIHGFIRGGMRVSIYTRASRLHTCFGQLAGWYASYCDKCWTFFFFFNNKFFKDISPFCGSFGILFWTFVLDFKARVDLWIACFLACVKWIPEINLRCDTCWPLDSQHGSRTVFDPRTCTRIFRHWWEKWWTFKLCAWFSGHKLHLVPLTTE